MMNPTAWNMKGKTAFVWASTAAVMTVWVFFRLPECKVSKKAIKHVSIKLTDFVFDRDVHMRSWISCSRRRLAPGNSKRQWSSHTQRKETWFNFEVKSQGFVLLCLTILLLLLGFLPLGNLVSLLSLQSLINHLSILLLFQIMSPLLSTARPRCRYELDKQKPVIDHMGKGQEQAEAQEV
jgi:hypothetical protein